MASSQPKKDDKPTSSTEAKPEETQQKSATTLEEDDEFEDFPVEGKSDPVLPAPPSDVERCLLMPGPLRLARRRDRGRQQRGDEAPVGGVLG